MYIPSLPLDLRFISKQRFCCWEMHKEPVEEGSTSNCGLWGAPALPLWSTLERTNFRTLVVVGRGASTGSSTWKWWLLSVLPVCSSGRRGLCACTRRLCCFAQASVNRSCSCDFQFRSGPWGLWWEVIFGSGMVRTRTVLSMLSGLDCKPYS